MSAELLIRYDFNKDRSNPAEVFEAIGLYVRAYQSLIDVMAESMGLEESPQLILGDVKEGSILSKLKSVASTLADFPQAALINSAIKSVAELQENMHTEDHVNRYAEFIENDLTTSQNLPIRPCLDRTKLMKACVKCSEANSKVAPDESVTIESHSEEFGSQRSTVKNDWRFTGNVRVLFQDQRKTYNNKTLHLLVKKPVNKGKDKWGVHCYDLKMDFYTAMGDSNWLENYQSGAVPPIGPNDVLQALVDYTVTIPAKKPETFTVTSAKVTEVIDVKRNSRQQHELEFDDE